MMVHIITIKFHRLIPIIYLQISPLMSNVSLNGGPSITLWSGGSVPRAKAANVSMTRLIQRS